MAEDIMHPILVREKTARSIKKGRRHFNTYSCCCGTHFIARSQDVKSGRHKTCGCGSFVKTTHDMSRHSLYKVHKNMLSRCRNSNNKSYKDYGGRGINVCDEWVNDRASFFAWALANGWKIGLFIDRISCDGNYEPSNCRFVSMAESNKNKRPRKKNLTDAQVSEAARMIAAGIKARDVANNLGVGTSTLYKRVRQTLNQGAQNGQ